MAEVRILGPDDKDPTPPFPPAVRWATNDEHVSAFLLRDEADVVRDLLAVKDNPPSDHAERDDARAFVGRLHDAELAGASRFPVAELLLALKKQLAPAPAAKPPADDWMTDDERAFAFLNRDEGTVLSELLAMMAAPPTDATERDAARSFAAALKRVEGTEANRGPVMERLFAYEVLLKGPGAKPKEKAPKKEGVVGTIGGKDGKAATVAALAAAQLNADPNFKGTAEVVSSEDADILRRAEEFVSRDEADVLDHIADRIANLPTDIEQVEHGQRHVAAILHAESAEGRRRPNVLGRLNYWSNALRLRGLDLAGKGPAPEPTLGLEPEPVHLPGNVLELPETDTIPVPVDITVTPYESGLISTALEHRREDLVKLAKKTEEESYPVEARRFLNDAGTIGEVILPRFKAQQELALATPVEVRSAIANRLRETVRRALVKKDPDIEAALGGIAALVEPLLTGAVDRGYAAGLAARHHDPNVIILKAIEAAAMAKFEET